MGIKTRIKKHIQADKYVLADYQNPGGHVSIQDVNTLLARNYAVFVFDGQNGEKVRKSFFRLFIQPEINFWFELVDKPGKNKVDGIIGCWALDIFRRQDNAHVHILSRDKGYDSLIEFCRKISWSIERNCCVKNLLKTECDCK